MRLSGSQRKALLRVHVWSEVTVTSHYRILKHVDLSKPNSFSCPTTASPSTGYPWALYISTAESILIRYLRYDRDRHRLVESLSVASVLFLDAYHSIPPKKGFKLTQLATETLLCFTLLCFAIMRLRKLRVFSHSGLFTLWEGSVSSRIDRHIHGQYESYYCMQWENRRIVQELYI